MPEEGGDCTRVLMVCNDNTKPLQQPNDHAHVCKEQMHREDCSLAIDPTHVEDNGTYQVHLFFHGQQFNPFKQVKVHVRDCHHKPGAPNSLCDEMDNTSRYNIASGVAGGAVVTSSIHCLTIEEPPPSMVVSFKKSPVFHQNPRTQYIQEGRESPIEVYNLAK